MTIKTLKDCILEGGIKGQIFTDLSAGSKRNYRVLDIKSPRLPNSPNCMFVEYLDNGKKEYMSMDEHSRYDISVEPNQPTQNSQESFPPEGMCTYNPRFFKVIPKSQNQDSDKDDLPF